MLGKPEDAACHEVNLRFGGINDEPEELVCCQDSNIDMDLCDFKEGYSCMQEKVGRHFSIRCPKYIQTTIFVSTYSTVLENLIEVIKEILRYVLMKNWFVAQKFLEIKLSYVIKMMASNAHLVT